VAKKNPERKRQLLRLTSGNTVISDVLKNGENVEMTKPMEVIVMPDRQGRTMITLMDFIPGSAQDIITFHRSNVVCYAKPDDRVSQLYEQVINPSPVETVEKPGLVLPPGAQ